MYLYVFHKHSVGGTILPQTKIKFLSQIVENEMSMLKCSSSTKIGAWQVYLGIENKTDCE